MQPKGRIFSATAPASGCILRDRPGPARCSLSPAHQPEGPVNRVCDPLGSSAAARLRGVALPQPDTLAVTTAAGGSRARRADPPYRSPRQSATDSDVDERCQWWANRTSCGGCSPARAAGVPASSAQSPRSRVTVTHRAAAQQSVSGHVGHVTVRPTDTDRRRPSGP